MQLEPIRLVTYMCPQLDCGQAFTATSPVDAFNRYLDHLATHDIILVYGAEPKRENS